MGNKQGRCQNRYYYDPNSHDTRSIQSVSAYSSFSESYADHERRSGYSFSESYADRQRRSSISTRYTRIGDDYYSLEQVTSALSQAGLESSNLIVGTDFTKSNEWTGSRSFQRKSLHHLGDYPNPYEQAISIIGRTLASFDEDNLIPCFGFGDASTHDQEVFSFYPDYKPCNGFEEVLARYRELVPRVTLAGPTSFAPIIETAIDIVDSNGGQYHVLLIIADGQVTRSVETTYGQLSPQEEDTINAIVKASEYPLSIVLVGVGDGPWDMMHQFDDNIPSRAFDNFQFVNFTEIMLKHMPMSKKETDFALAALMEIPSQYRATIDLQLLGRRRGAQRRYPLPPPQRTNLANSRQKHTSSSSKEDRPGFYYIPSPSHSLTQNFSPSASPNPHTENQSRTHKKKHTSSSSKEDRPGFYYIPSPSHSLTQNSSPSASPNPYTENQSRTQNKDCPICLWNTKDLAFGCGHLTCYDCGRELTLCPICRTYVTTRIRLYD